MPLVAVLVMAWSFLGAAPAHAAVEYLGVPDWSTFASWKAPSSPSESWVWPWGTTDRESGAVAGEVIWQGEWHSPYDVPQNWFFTWGGVKVTWTAPM